jgi:class 3 adenylate cyclase/YHS domain-containing protein
MSSGPSIDELATAIAEPVDRVQAWLALGVLGVVGPDGRLPADVPVRARLVRLCLDHGIDMDVIARWARTGEMDRHVALLAPAGVRPTYNLSTTAGRLGIDGASLERLCRGIGLVPGVFDDEDLAALALFKRARDAGFPEDALVQLVRVLKDAMDRVADAEAHLFHFYVRRALQARGLAGEALQTAVWAVGEATAGLDAPALQYFHRRALRHALEHTAVLEVAEHLSSVEQPPGQLEVTIVFVDLSGFTALTEAMGDVKTAEVLDRFSGLVRESVTAFGGHVVKQIGDAFLLVFHEPRAAVACALDIEARVTAAPAFPAVRAGIHHGPVLYREGDYVGATVNLAARVVAEADRHQVLVTEAVRTAVRTGGDVELVRLPKRTVKGVRDEIVLYDVRPATVGPRALRVTDPVCAMELGPGEDAARLVLEGHEYRFCSDDCLRRFVAAPQRYAGAAGAGTPRAPAA